MADSRYSFSLTTFSPSGKLVQIEYALQAVSAGNTSLGIKAKNGVVIASEKKLPSLMDGKSMEKLVALSAHNGMIYSGLTPDARILAKKGRKRAQQYFRTHLEEIPVNQLVRELASIMQEFTQSGGVRPFGVSLLIAGYDEHGPQLFQVDPSGSYWGWKATAIGKNSVNAKTFLEKRYSDELDLHDAVHTAVLTLKEGFEGELTEENMEIGIVTKDGFRILSQQEVKEYIDEVD